jgi:hypothetical protein
LLSASITIADLLHKMVVVAKPHGFCLTIAGHPTISRQSPWQ